MVDGLLQQLLISGVAVMAVVEIEDVIFLQNSNHRTESDRDNVGLPW